MGRAFNVGKLFGIQFRLHYTWFIIFFLITISLSWQFFPSSYPGWPLALYWILGVLTGLLFFASVVAHELAHSLVGRANGIPVKSITLFVFGGVSMMTKEPAKAKDELLMAGAGPVCSLVIAVFFGLVWFATQNVIEPLSAMALWLAYINVMLAVFNLIPGFPLDGGRVFRSLAWRVTGDYRRSTRVASWLGQGIGYLFIVGGILIGVMRPFGLHWFSGVWLAFIGWFLTSAASASYRQVLWREALRRVSASQVMSTDCAGIPPDITISQLIQGYILARGNRCFLVGGESWLEGVLTLSDVKSIPRQNWEITPVREIMTATDKLRIAPPDLDASSVLAELDESGESLMPVVREGRVMGLITRDSLMRYLRIHSELGI